MIISSVIFLLLIPLISAELFIGKCPRIATTVGLSFIHPDPTSFYAASLIPQEVGHDSFNFYISEDEIFDEYPYVFSVDKKLVSWNYHEHPCLLYLGIYRKEGKFGNTFLARDSDNKVVCESDKWTFNAMVAQLPEKDLMLIVGCREVNQTHYDLALWTLLALFGNRWNEYFAHSKLLNYHTRNLFRHAGLSEIHFDRLQTLNIPDIRMLNLSTAENPLRVCYSDLNCERKPSKSIVENKKNVVISWPYIVLGVVCLMVIILAIKYL